MEYTLNEDKIKEFLDNKELPLDHIFDEINSLYNNENSSSNKSKEILSEDNQTDLKQYIAQLARAKKAGKQLTPEQERLLSQYVQMLNQQKAELQELNQSNRNAYLKGKAVANVQLNPNQQNSEMQKQLLINQKLQQDLYRINNMSTNKEQCINAYNNPQAYMAQNRISAAVIPRELRQKKDNFNPMKMFSNVMCFLSPIMSVSYMIMFFTGTFPELINRFFSFLWNSIITGNHIANAGYKYLTDEEQQEASEAHRNYTAAIDKYYDTKNTRNVDKKEIEEQKKILTHREEQLKRFRPDGKGGFTSSEQDTEIGLNMYTMSIAIRYIVIAYILYWIINKAYNWYQKKVQQKKKEEYAQTHNMSVQEVTIPLLCESSKENMIYFKEMEVCNEALSQNLIKTIMPTTKNMLIRSNKSLVALNGLSKTIETGIKSKAISPLLAKGGNILLGTCNSVIIPSRGAIMSGVLKA